MYKNLWQLIKSKILIYSTLAIKQIHHYKYIFIITILSFVACSYFYQRLYLCYYSATAHVKLLNTQHTIPSERLFFNKVYDSLIVNKSNLTIEHTKKHNVLTIRANGKTEYRAQNDLQDLISLYKQEALKIKSQKLTALNDSIKQLRDKLFFLNKSTQLSTLNSNNKQGELSLIRKQKEQEKKLKILEVFNAYVSRPASSFVLIPESFVVEDNNLQMLINKFNDLQLQKQSYIGARGQNGANTVNFNDQIIALQNQIKRKISIQKSALQQQLSPGNFKQPSAFQNNLTAVAISLAIDSFKNLTQEISTSTDKPSLTASVTDTSVKPIYPQSFVLYTGAILLGILFSMLAIFLLNNHNNKVNDISNLKAITSIPFAGEISYNPKAAITISKNNSSIAAITSFINQSNKEYQILWVTSFISGSAIEYLGLNLAQQLVSAGKKAIVINYDPSNLQASYNDDMLYYTKGLHNYLNANDTTIDELIVPVSESNTLYYIGAGVNQNKHNEKMSAMLNILEMSPHLSVGKESIEQNTPDQKFEQLISYLQKEFNYIVVCGLLPEPQAHPIASLADITICLIDYQTASKTDFIHLNELWEANKLNNPFIVANRT